MNANGDTPHHPRYHFSTYLGHGSDGKVWKAQYVGAQNLGSLKPGTNVAIKLVPSGKIRVNEVLLQAQLRHLNIVQLYDIFEYDDGLGMVMELADYQKLKLDGPSLWDCIKSCVDRNQKIKVYETEEKFNRDGSERFCRPLRGGEPTLRWVFLQVASALDFLHRHPQRLCNRDVKPHNVLVVDFAPHRDNIFRPVIKLADFGFCRATDVEPAVSRLGTPAYAAPEIINQRAGVPTGYDGPKADVWSAGVLLYVLAAGIEPFKEKSDLQRPGDANNAVMRRIASKNYNIFTSDRIGHLSPDLQDLLKRMLDPNPATRPTMLEVIEHRWSRKLNQDIQTRPGVEGAGEYLPAWDLLYDNIRSSIKAAEQHEGQEWTLPMPRAEVEDLLIRCKERAR